MCPHPYANWERHLLYEQTYEVDDSKRHSGAVNQFDYYPSKIRKEPPVKKLTLDHADAISTAKLNLIRLTDRDTHPRFKVEIEKRIERLGEVYWWVLHAIYNPGLPMNGIPEPKDAPKTEEPKDNGTAAGTNGD